ncbi:unnamed protein product [Durusdinium trenchii]|uniref:Uncharacterized protein n=1 Tax=Durusdinium trenchii TaxID=1381693 RepID=A0ABP0KV00_9DINO
MDFSCRGLATTAMLQAWESMASVLLNTQARMPKTCSCISDSAQHAGLRLWKCEEAQRIFHEKASDFARAQLIMKEARTEAEEALQLRWSRPWVQEMDELGRKVRADAGRISSTEARAVSEEIGQEMSLEMQEVAEAIGSISSEHRALQKEAMLEMRSHHRALSRELAALERRVSAEARKRESDTLQMVSAEEHFAEQASEVAELAVAGQTSLA